MRRLRLPLAVALLGTLGCGGESATSDAQPQPATSQSGSGADQAAEVQRKPVEVGVGEKAQSITGEGPIATPVKTLYRAEERIQLLNLKHAYDIHKQLHGAPKSHEEYMDKFVKANNLQLPRLPDGQRYVYDPEREELMIEVTTQR
jgi:hypothetical protein